MKAKINQSKISYVFLTNLIDFQESDEETKSNKRKNMGKGKQKAAKGGKKFQQNLTRLQQIDEAEDEISLDEETTKNNKKAKKAKPKKTKKQLQITLTSESGQSEIESATDEEIQCSESEDTDTDSKDPKKKKGEWKKELKEVGWTMDPNEHQPQGPKLNLQGFEVFDELGYLIRFLPVDYIHNAIPVTNQAGSRRQNFKDLSLEELMKFLGLMFAMEIVKMPNQCMYWDT